MRWRRHIPSGIGAVYHRPLHLSPGPDTNVNPTVAASQWCCARTFQPGMLVYDLATARSVAQREDALLLGPPGAGKSHLAQAIGRAAIQQGYRVVYREAHTLIEEIADATLGGTRKEYLANLASVPLLIIDDLGMRKLPHTAAEDLLELVMRRYERASTILTSNRPVDDWGRLLGDTAAVTALLDRLLHHAHVLKCGPRSWAPRSTSTCVRRQLRSKPLLVSDAHSEMAGFEASTEARLYRLTASGRRIARLVRSEIERLHDVVCD